MNSTDLKELCTSNASVAAQYGRMDLVQAWSTALLIADLGMKSPDSADNGVPWPEHPFGKNLIHSLYVLVVDMNIPHSYHTHTQHTCTTHSRTHNSHAHTYTFL